MSVKTVPTHRRDEKSASHFPWPFVLWIFLCVGVTHAPAQNQTSTVESFDSDPLARGWRIGGDPTLFTWNAANHGIDVVWDSSKSNSFFHRSLGTVLTKVDDFELTFVLKMADIMAGPNPAKPAEFPIAIGLINRLLVTNQTAYRGAGVSSLYGLKNIAEWNFFPDAGFGDTWATTVISSNNVFAYGHTFPLPLETGSTYRIALRYDATNRVMRTTALRNGQSIGALENVSLSATPDFRVDAVSVTSYSDAVQTGPLVYYGSVLAHGTLEEISWTIPASPVLNLSFHVSNADSYIEFLSKSGWLYVLERSNDLLNWQPASVTVPGTGSSTRILETNAPALAAFYRIRADRL